MWPTVTRGYADPPTALFRFNGRARHRTRDRDEDRCEPSRSSARRLRTKCRGSPPSCRSASRVHLVADQPVVVEHAVSGFTEALFEAVVIVLGDQLPEPWASCRSRRCDRNPAGSRHHVCRDGLCRNLAAANFARRLDHRAWPSGRRRHDRGRDDGGAARSWRPARKGRDPCLHVDGLSHADRDAGHRCRLHPDWPQQQHRR